MIKNDAYYMGLALKEAKKAAIKNEVPVGAVIVLGDKVIAKAYNKRVEKEQTHAHAEMMAIQTANRKLGSWRLEDCRLYVTLEPCPMCAGAIIQSRIKTLYFGAKDPKGGVAGSVINLFDVKFNHQVEVVGGILEEACSNELKNFFKILRNNK
jgi:tRNA(adenine34) deaminase